MQVQYGHRSSVAMLLQCHYYDERRFQDFEGGGGAQGNIFTAFMNKWPADGWVWFTTLSSLHDQHKLSNKMAAGGQK